MFKKWNPPREKALINDIVQLFMKPLVSLYIYDSHKTPLGVEELLIFTA